MKNLLTLMLCIALAATSFSCTKDDVNPDPTCAGSMKNFVQQRTGQTIIGEGEYIDRSFAQNKPSLSCTEITAFTAMTFTEDKAAGYGQWWETTTDAGDYFYGIYTHPDAHEIEVWYSKWHRINGVLTPGFHIEWSVVYKTAP